MTRTSRTSRFLTVMCSLLALLFAQAALASYTCPAIGQAVQAAQMAEPQMPCAGAMVPDPDEAQPVLCHAHCQSSPQSSDHHQPPVLGTLAELGAVLSAPSAPAPALRYRGVVRRDSGPPLAIRNCCWRI